MRRRAIPGVQVARRSAGGTLAVPRLTTPPLRHGERTGSTVVYHDCSRLIDAKKSVSADSEDRSPIRRSWGARAKPRPRCASSRFARLKRRVAARPCVPSPSTAKRGMVTLYPRQKDNRSPQGR
jgi:hypothetical protein